MKSITKINKLAVVLSLVLSAALSAQEIPDWLKGLTVNGSADVFYKYDFSKSDFNTKTSFTEPNNSFELGMFSLKINHKAGKFSTTADIGVGSRAEKFNYTQSNTGFLIKQLYIDYAATDKLTVSAGSWTTHIGYELLDAPDNDIYSMSYAFSYGPFFHTGVKANYVEGKFNIMAGVANPTDLKSSFQKTTVVDGSGNTTTESYKNKFFIWQLGYTGDKLGVFLNGQQGSYNPQSSNISQFDLTASYKFTDKFKLGLNATTFMLNDDDSKVSKTKWTSLVGYLKYSFTPSFALNYRAEYLDNKDNVLALGAINGNTVFANTISATISKGNFQLKPELRFENASEDIYFDRNKSATNSSANFLIAAMYKF